MIDIFAARRFLNTLIRDGSPAVFQTFDDNRERQKAKAPKKELARKFEGDITKLAPIFANFQKAGAGVFFQINAGGRGAPNVTAVRSLFADDDEQGRKLDLSKCPPTMTVESSPGKYQYYWVLKDGHKLRISDFRTGQRHLIAALGTDKSIHNADRVMRLPGSLHLKDPNAPFRVRLVECVPERVYDIREVLDAFPVPVGFVDPQEAETEPKTSEATKEAEQSLKRVLSWLERRKIGYNVKANDPYKIIFDTCVFNSEHRGEHGMAIKIAPGGGIWCGCWHNSCGGNTQRWKEVRDIIGHWSGVPGFYLGDHIEMARRALADLRLDSTEMCVGYGGGIYRYSQETFLWESVGEDDQTRVIAGFSSLPRGKTGQMRIKWNDISGTIKAIKQLANQERFFDAAPRGIMFKNGFLEVTEDGVVLRPPSARYRQRDRLPFDWDPNAAAERFALYLREVFAGDPDAELKIALLQEFAGAALLGIAPSFQKTVMLLGEGANGKSVFLSILRALFPPKYVTAVRPQEFSNEYYRVALAGARLNVVNEMPETNIIDSESFKAIIDGSLISGRHPYQESFWFTSEAANIFACNRLPGTLDYTHGFWRRCIVVPFNRTFDESEMVRNLDKEIIANEQSGVAAWAIKGAMRLLANKEYTVPPSSRATLGDWVITSDVVHDFIESCCSRGGKTQARDLYATFRQWLAENGHRQMSSTTFGRRLRNLKVPNRKSNGVVVYELTCNYSPSSFVTF